ncbi:MAG: aldolase [Clostridia bacterium]|nr:aldolase [Clostridia bacterium]
MQDLIKNFKNKLHSDGVVGMFSKTCDPALIEIMGYAGMDYVIIDLEHGPNAVQSVQNLIRGAQVAGVMPIVRVKESCASVMGEVLDIGAGGIQVPQITTREEAEAVMKRTKFSPVGERGVCRFVRAAQYSAKDRFEYFKDANQTVTVLQIEGQEGIAHIDEILSVAGIDVIFIGPYDLSQSLGVAGQIDHPLVEQKMLEIVNKCTEKGITVGTFVDTVENAKKWRALGVKYLSYSVDMGVFYEATASIVKQLNAK